jgi:hypothetical protein
MPRYDRWEFAIKLGIRGILTANAIIALFFITGCGAAGAPGATGVSAAASANGGLGLNGPFGRGGPFEGTAATAGLANSSGGKIGVTVQVGGSTAMEEAHKMPWLFALGYGISASAPLIVRPGTDSPADAAVGFYDAFYEQRFAAACRYVVPARQASCPVLLRESSGSADTLDSPAIGFVVAKGDQALVTMTGVLCRTATGCVGQHNPDWIFGLSYPFDTLWSATARDGGNPLTVTPFTRAAGRWYLNLPARIP